MPNMIYKVLIIQIILTYEAYTREVHMTNVSEVLGTDSIKLRCLYTKDPADQVSGVNFHAINDSTDTFVNIAESSVFSPQTKLLPYGVYLFGSANITKFSVSLSEVVLTFNDLKCKHERNYKCMLSVHQFSPIDSAPMEIFVRVPPSKPDKVEIIRSPMDVSTTTDTTSNNTSTSVETESVYTSTPIESESAYNSTPIESESVYTSTPTESDSVYTSTPTESESFYTSKPSGPDRLYTSTPPGTENSTVIILPRSDKNPTTSLQNFGSPIVDNNITSTTKSFYNSTSGHEPTTVSPIIMEGNNITVRCSGNVGKPAGIFIFKKFRKDHTHSIDYNATTTETEKIPENCSYYRTSYLIFQLTAEDNQAVIRCVVVSPLAEQDMYIDSEQLEVKYNVRIPIVRKYPDKQEYIVGEDTSITLTCTTDGNPKPIYRWYKDNHDDNMSTAENITLKNINTTDSGLYICNVSNTINGLTYTEAAQMEVHIMNKADKSTTQSTSTGSSSGADDTNESSSGPVLGGVVGSVFVFLIVLIIVFAYCLHKRRKKRGEIPLLKNESQGGDGSKSKPIAESKTGNYDYIALEEDVNKTQTVNNEHEVEDIIEHNKEYLKKQEEEEQKKNESNSSPQPAVYAQVNEATKSKNTETQRLAEKQEEGTNAESQEWINDENEHDEHFATSDNSSKQNSNDDTELSKLTSQTGCYNNQAFEKDENRKVATVSPRIRSPGDSQDDEQTNQNRDSQSKQGYKNGIGKDQTDTSKEDDSHRIAL